MKLAMLACLAALCLTGPIAHAAPGETTRAAPTANGTHPPETATPHPAPAPAPGAAPAQAAPRTANSARAERRRRSYAACNRASHQRGLRGGKRRRFLIRCRLGYERTRIPGGQPAAAAPAQPGRKP
ncbi:MULTISPECIES: hypothetical protein [Methylobacterium]|uniref:hypothetical protein n=1 Tax=Methylobacterium TaxID=407 RepID=UPI0003479BBB|nr:MULTISPECIES: hypothetical protein [Methylobacterium]KQS81899.1 hypothetical protein ASG32_03905 [Methylobacterium sp. Leaf361]MBN4094343.1 hypothetical protein [Methylobacterium sp. OT2]UIN33238.1 hypothetical protein LXM90_19345 [Methylobacterium oryzae]SEG25992.1 hypothetical protein SAMN04488144_112101 [Methylobacterium sp. 190mf]SEH76341.1 hypothetical protein SAMN02799636_03780 [Methylobacterium sp. 275MFSha3.1]